MPKGHKTNPKDVEKVEKTGVVLGVANLFLLPFYYADSRWGFTASLALTFAVLYGMHEIGKERRLVENAINSGNNLFARNKSGSNIENAFNNIIEGGEAVFGEVRDGFSQNGKRSNIR